jgi:lipopolysaccharide transport system permease protein
MTSEWLKELWVYRELLYFFAWRDVKIRYKQAALGAAWAILQPLLTMLIFTVVFGKLAGTGSGNIPYPVFTFCALVPWSYFAATLAFGSSSLIMNTTLITKVYFPRVLLPTASAMSGLVDFAISSVLLIAMMLYYHVGFGKALFLLPVMILAMIALTTSVSMLLGAMNVRYRDVKYVVPFLVQIWLFVTPVIYPASAVPAKYRLLVVLNPMSGIVEGFRLCLFPLYHVDRFLMEGSFATIVTLMIVSLIYFRRTEREFADII